MGYIGKSPPPSALTASDISDGIISEAKLATNSVSEVKMADDAISLTELKAGTDGEIISWDASGNPVAIGAGTSGHFLKSQGAGSQPVFAEAAGGMHTLISTTDITSDTATFDGDQLLPSTYNNFVIDFFNICPTDGSNVDMIMYMRSGGAGSESTFTGNVQYARVAYHGSNFLTDAQDSSGGHMRFHRSGSVGNDDNTGGYYRAQLFNVHNKAPSTTTSVGYLHFIMTSVGQVSASTYAYGSKIYGLIKTETDYTGFHLVFGTAIRGANRPRMNIYGVNNVN